MRAMWVETKMLFEAEDLRLSCLYQIEATLQSISSHKTSGKFILEDFFSRNPLDDSYDLKLW